MFDRDKLEQDKFSTAIAQAKDIELQKRALDLVVESDKYGYAYQWTWLGLPMIQLPADIVATQEIIWKTQPDIIIETGVAWGGSILMYASLMQLYGKGKVIGIDLNLYEHVESQIASYPFSHRIELIKGSSTDHDIVSRVKKQIQPGQKVMLLLDSNHTHEHVLEELRLYAPMVTKDQYLVVSDTIVEDIPVQLHRPRPWGPGNNPKSALIQYLKEVDRFEVDEYINSKMLTTFNPMGYVKCVK
jgi:cephalosporin hydroxylase